MTELGAQDWELATAFLDMALHREKDGTCWCSSGGTD